MGTNRKLAQVIGAFAIATAVVGTVGAGSLSASARPGTYSIKTENLIPEINTVEEQHDSLPPALKELAEDGPIKMESVRLIAQSAYGSHWAGLSDNDEVCIMTSLSDDSASAIGCTPRPLFHQNGASHGLDSLSAPGVVVHLIPDGVSENDVRDAVASSAAERSAGTAFNPEQVEFQLLGDTRVLVMGQDDAAPDGDIRIARDGQDELVLFNLTGPE